MKSKNEVKGCISTILVAGVSPTNFISFKPKRMLLFSGEKCNLDLFISGGSIVKFCILQAFNFSFKVSSLFASYDNTALK